MDEIEVKVTIEKDTVIEAVKAFNVDAFIDLVDEYLALNGCNFNKVDVANLKEHIVDYLGVNHE